MLSEAKIQTVEDIYRAGLDGGGEQTSDSSHLSGTRSVVLPAPVGPESRKDSFGCCATSTAERARADCKPLVHRQTGVALRWRSSAEWSYWKTHGARRRIIPAHSPAWSKPILMPRIIRSGSAKGTVRQLPEQQARQNDSQRRDGVGLCRSGRTRRPARAEVRRRLRGG